MKFHPRTLLTVLTATTFLCSTAMLSYGQTPAGNPLYRHIPADADKIYHINYSAISSKLDWHALMSMAPQKGENAKWLTYVTNPSALGLDPRQGFMITQSNVMAVDSPRYTTILIPLSDSGKFIQAIKQQRKGKFIILPGKIRAAKDSTDKAYAWDDKLLVCVIVKPWPAVHPTQGGIQTNSQIALRNSRSALRKCLAALKGSDTNPFLTNPDFVKGFGDDADVHSWSRFGSGLGMMADAMRMSKAPVDKSFLQVAEQIKRSRSHTLGTFRFDNGLISFRSHVFYDQAINLDPGSHPLNTGLIDRLPQGNLLGLASIHIDPSAWLNLIQLQAGGKATHFLDSMLAKKDLTIKDILSAFKGDLLLAVIDSGKTTPATDSTPARPGKPNVYVVVTISDANAFNKLNDVLHLTRDAAAPVAADTATASKKSKKWHPAHTLRDNILVLGPSQQATDDYFNKTGRGPSRLVTDDIRSAPVALAVDMKALGEFLQPMFVGNSPKDKQMQTLLGTFDRIVFTTARIHGREMESAFEIRMTDSQQNSLTTLTKLIQSMSGK
ncbi:hypothetical protein [Puia sp.]|jgi:hypothetical protein|uniref:hypothetical protein n=1 Tax=Puia sp. TaxID=2045100 RepID=UPI002F418567